MFKRLDLNQHILLFDVGLQHLKRKIQENNDFPCLHFFTMKKDLVKIILGHKTLICRPISNFLWHFLRLLGCKGDHILLEVFQNKVICKKAVSKDGVRRVIRDECYE